MAIYRIFPEKDAFISSEKSTTNTGKDEILEIGGYPDTSGTGRANRSLIKFSDRDINNVVDNIIGSDNFTSTLHLSLAYASEIPTEFTLYGYPITGSWDEGIGRWGDLPIDQTGVNWNYKKASLVDFWEYIAYQPNWLLSSGFFNDSGSWVDTSLWLDQANSSQDILIDNEDKQSYFVEPQIGGGTWLTRINSASLEVSQSFSNKDTLDVNMDVHPIIRQFRSGSIQNEGIILKLENSLEFNENLSIKLKYFSSDTHTIYPPYLEFKWDDSTYNTGSLSILSTDQFKFNIRNNRGVYTDTGKYRFNLSIRPQFPTRTFSTTSLYITNYALSEETYWGLKDYNSNEMIVDFDTVGTKVSCNESGPYFDVYLDGLQPERYYKVMIKTTINGSTFIIDTDNIFKIENNG